MSERGRNTVRTPDVAAKIFEAVRKGAPYAIACAYAGISETTFYDWKANDQDFSDNIKAASAESAIYHLDKINSDPAWQSSGWLLERRYPEHFAKREHLDVTSKGDKIDTVRVILTDTDEDGE